MAEIRFRWRPEQRPDTHLQVSVVFKNAAGGQAWLDQIHAFRIYDTPEAQLAAVLERCTPFVQQNWIRVEVCVPNRDAYGTLQPGWIGKDCGLLLATRTTEKEDTPL